MTILYNTCIYFFLVILSMTAVGCVNLEKNYPERKYYIFNVTPEVNQYPTNIGSVLEVRRFRVSSAYHGNEFVYRISKDGYKSDFYNQFFRSPASLITEVVHKWLSNSSPFEYVVGVPSDVQPDYILDGLVNAIFGDYIESASPKAVIRIQFFMINRGSTESEIVFTKSYSESIDISSNSPTALMNGWNAALKAILTDLGSDLRKLNLTASN